MSQDESFEQQKEKFFSSAAFAVAGASSRREKYGNKVLRCYLQHQKTVFPVNPIETEIEGIPVISKIIDLPASVKSLSIVTPPKVTERIVDEAIAKGIQHIWMQPGAESQQAIQHCIENGVTIIAGGPCILVAMGYREMS